MAKDVTPLNATTSPQVFVSHAHKDHRLADAFVEMLCDGLDIPRKERRNYFFCSSIEWTNIKGGKKKVDRIMAMLKNAKVHIALITPNFLRSETCNAELGYMWAEPEIDYPNFFPLKMKLPPKRERPWYLQQLETFSLTEESVLNDVKRMILPAIGKEDCDDNSWKDAREKFQNTADHLVSDVPLGIDYRSMGQFMDACESKSRIIFFNVQVAFDDWFRPELQTHLAIQDATATYYQLSQVVDKEEGSAYATKQLKLTDLQANYGTPTARVLFVRDTWKELANALQENTSQMRSLVDLILIHMLMSTPLAIVTADYLAEIMLAPNKKTDNGELDFISSTLDYSSTLNLPRAKKGMSEEDLTKKIQDAFDTMLMLPVLPEDDVASIDFAMLKESSPTGSIDIWRARLTELRYLEYYDLGMNAGKTKSDIFAAFGKAIENSVFESLGQEDENEQLEARAFHQLLPLKENGPDKPTEYHRLLATRYPPYKVFHDYVLDGKNGWTPCLIQKFLNAIKFVKPKYCPLLLIDKVPTLHHIFQIIPK